MEKAKIDPYFWCMPIEVKLKATSTICLPPYPGSTIRGSLGMALLRISCVLKRQRCNECPLSLRCVYTYLFETPLHGEGEESKRFPNAPHPFVLDVDYFGDGTEKIIEAGENFSFGMTLIGEGTYYLPHFLNAFSVMGEMGIGKGRGKFEVEAVTSGGEKIYDGETFRWPQNYLTWEKSVRKGGAKLGDSLSVSFLSPLRMVFRKEFVKNPEFHVLVGNLIQRIENLRRFHCKSDVSLFGKDLVEKAKAVRLVENKTFWADWERYSHRKQRRMKLGGIVGTAVYEGEFSDFMPLVILGEWVHVGKGTSFGLGKIRRLS